MSRAHSQMFSRFLQIMQQAHDFPTIWKSQLNEMYRNKTYIYMIYTCTMSMWNITSMLALYTLICFQETCLQLYIPVFAFDIISPHLNNELLPHRRAGHVRILDSQYQGCWWPDIARIQGISSDGIDLMCMGNFNAWTMYPCQLL